MLLQKIDTTPTKLGDFNNRVATDFAESMPDVVGKYSLCENNESGFRLFQFCAVKKLVFFLLINLISFLNIYTLRN